MLSSGCPEVADLLGAQANRRRRRERSPLINQSIFSVDKSHASIDRKYERFDSEGSYQLICLGAGFISPFKVLVNLGPRLVLCLLEVAFILGFCNKKISFVYFIFSINSFQYNHGDFNNICCQNNEMYSIICD